MTSAKKPTPSMEELQDQLAGIIEQMSQRASKIMVSQMVIDALGQAVSEQSEFCEEVGKQDMLVGIIATAHHVAREIAQEIAEKREAQS